MTEGSYLLAPMELNAMMVNSPVLNLTFRRWRQQYTNLTNYNSPIPGPFQGEIDQNFSRNDANRGVYLQWQPPKSLKQGLTSNATSTPVFPLLPNRWLVARFYGTGSQRKVKAWVVESDCPNDDVANRTVDSSPYLVGADLLNLWQASRSPARQNVARENLQSGTPVSTTGYNILLGKVFDLATWTEQGIDQQFLTAMAPGNTEFIAYQPMVGNIFSFHDRVQNDPEVTEGMALSYFVAGWYSVPGADPLAMMLQPGANAATFDSILAGLQWQLAAMSSGTAQSLITHGLQYNLVWQNTKIPDNQIQAVTDLHVAIGNNATDAFQNMVNQQLQDQAKVNPQLQQLLDSLPDASHLLEAFQYGMLYLLDQPGGNIALQNAIREQWYMPRPGGSRWTIVDAENMKLTGTDQQAQAAEIARETPWLEQLNADQDVYDGLRQQLARAQSDLFGLWWKSAYFKKNYNPFQSSSWVVTADDFAVGLDPNNPNSVVYLVNALNRQVAAMAPKVPQPIYLQPTDSPDVAQQNGVDAFMTKQRNAGLLSATRILKSTVQPSFFAPNDPVVLLSGAKTQQTVLDNSLLSVRKYDAVVNAFVDRPNGTVTVANLGSHLPPLNFSLLPSVISALYAEAFLLDPVNAPAIAALIPSVTVDSVAQLMAAHAPENYQGMIPALALQNWIQPWNPLYFEWQVAYYPLDAHDAAGNANWAFDGTDYHFVGAVPSAPKTYNVAGRSIMTSQVTGVFQQQLQDYLNAHPDPQLQELMTQADLDHWDFLAQSFSGFNVALAQTVIANNRLDATSTFSSAKYGVPTTTIQVAELVAGETEILPMAPDFSALQTFQGVRRGQFCVLRMIVYDAFGQALDVVTSSSGLQNNMNFHPILGPELTPDKAIVAQNSYRFVQLPPRLIQPARLSFRWVDALRPTQFVDTSPTANPVGGWILPNHLEQGLSLYDAAGLSLGNVRLTVGVDGHPIVGWSPAPHSPVQSLAAFQSDSPLMWNWFNGLQQAGTTAFEAFLAAIDETLWTVDPMGARSDQNLSVLIGRPLALVRSQLQFQLNGAPIRDQTFPKTFDTTVPSYSLENFQIRLGEQELREDGLIGYYLDQNYRKFHNIHQPDGLTTDYLSAIAVGNFIEMPFDGKSTMDVMILLDPRAAVHAVTGILPVTSLSLPQQFVDPLLSHLEISFHVAPLLTETVANPDAQASATLPNAILIPTPVEQNGSWSWWELGAPLTATPQWAQLALKQETGVADITANDKTLRDGFLQLIMNAE